MCIFPYYWSLFDSIVPKPLGLLRLNVVEVQVELSNALQKHAVHPCHVYKP
jgi:hypothetical protein